MSTSRSIGKSREIAGIAFGLVFPTAVTLVYFVLLAGYDSALQQTAYAVGKLLQFGFPVVWIGLVHRRPLALRGPRSKELIEGAALGLAILAAMLVLYFGWLKNGAMPPQAVEAIRVKVAGMGVTTPARFLAMGLFYALGHSLLEEYYWRWFVFDRLCSLTKLWIAVAVSALGFTAHHVCVLALYFGWTSGWTWFFSLSVAVGGVLWSLLYRRHGSLYGVWISHLLVDAGIFAVGYDLVL